ncbi:hypothetical protein FQA39_LY14000 [Lamprigera yunnana]|nr:hypothetical protein FQA39_LY14000 [Lamprigera yunnana]
MMEVLNVVAVIADINKLCRICLNEELQSELCNIHENNVGTMIENLINTKPRFSDSVPNSICKGCAERLSHAVTFKVQCLESEERIKFLLNTKVTTELDFNEYKEEIKNIENNASLPKKSVIKRRKKKNWSSPCHSSEDELFIDEISEEKDQKGTWLKLPDSKDRQKENDHLEPKHTCNKCKKTFRSTSGYRVHLIKHGNELTCEVCRKTFRLVKHLNAHTKLHKDYKPHVCKICSKGFGARGNLSKHMRVHGGEKKHLCTTCGRRFFEPGYLQVHMRTHTGEKPLICNVCGKRFSDPHGLVAHNKIHTGERKYECKTCGKKFAHSFVLTAHNRIHTGEKPYHCTICGASYATRSYLTIHKRIHTQEKPFNCESCPKAFVSRCALVAHTMTHTGEKRFECNICGKRVARAADLNIHLRSHTGERPYACDQCPKRYHTSSNLSAHKRTHLGIKNHICTICDKAFGDARTLKGHIRIHTGEKPYVCQICFNRYSQSGQLAAHRKTHLAVNNNMTYLNIDHSNKEENHSNAKVVLPSQIVPLNDCNEQFLQFKGVSSTYENNMVSHINLKQDDVEMQSQELILLNENQNHLIHLSSHSPLNIKVTNIDRSVT